MVKDVIWDRICHSHHHRCRSTVWDISLSCCSQEKCCVVVEALKVLKHWRVWANASLYILWRWRVSSGSQVDFHCRWHSACSLLCFNLPSTLMSQQQLQAQNIRMRNDARLSTQPSQLIINIYWFHNIEGKRVNSISLPLSLPLNDDDLKCCVHCLRWARERYLGLSALKLICYIRFANHSDISSTS